MIKIGMMIGDRYEIMEKIGTGGMSDVYKAKCHKLNRFVAVKVLKQEFSENANFVRKFQVEAQAAAGLMHSNIVNVYDVGEEHGIYYIVMELVEGITLKKYIEKKARLSVKEAVSIAIQISMGIEAAHNNHIIHRDIKPQNIIISKEGKVKVTDFGIAKAATSNTITSNVMGSVHYTSPEQARGGYSDAKSDIYSLGITMFEMLTGRVPFNGETTVAIAIKHIQEILPSPREYVAEIPVSVEQIVFKCCEKSPDRRYQSMGELIADLKQSLISPQEDFVRMTHPDEEASTRKIPDKEIAEIRKQRIQPLEDPMEEPYRVKKEARVSVPQGTRPQKAAKPGHSVQEKPKPVYEKPKPKAEVYEEEGEEEEGGYDSRMERITTVLAIIFAVVIGCIALVLVGRVLGIPPFVSEATEEESRLQEEELQTEAEPEVSLVEMPKVVGRNIDEVKEELQVLGLYPEIVYREDQEYEEGLVLECNIGISQPVDQNTQILLTVSAGITGIEVPQVTGLSKAEAVANLEQKGFVVHRTESHDAEVPAGNVISQSPEQGTSAPSGSAVTIRISLGAEDVKIRVPNLIGSPEMDAIASLTELGLPVGSVTQVHNEDPALAGLVCYQSYSVGSYVDEGTAIDLQISIGPKQPTYQYSGNIEGPTAEEDPEYVGGSSVRVTIDTADGVQLLNTETTAFPIPVNYTGILSQSGTITFQYMVKKVETVTDPETGEVTATEGPEEQRTITRQIQFLQEG